MDHGLPSDVAIIVTVPVGGLILYRLLASNEPRVSDFEPGWTRAQGQLRGIPEVFRTSVGTWLEQSEAVAASNRRVAYVAQLALEPGPLTRVALTSPIDRGHVDVWGYPRELLGAVAAFTRLPVPQ